VPIRIDKTGFLVSNSPTLEFCDALLRGIGRVMFQNNTLMGAIIRVGIYFNSMLVGAGASKVTAYALDADRTPIKTGLYGFNGALVGIALAYFLRPEIRTWVYVVAAGRRAPSPQQRFQVYSAASVRT
jgi:urea transporter